MKNLVLQLSSNDNNVRTSSSDFLMGMKFEYKIYEILFAMFANENENKYFKLQAILIVKNLIKNEVNSMKSKFRVNGMENGK